MNIPKCIRRQYIRKLKHTDNKVLSLRDRMPYDTRYVRKLNYVDYTVQINFQLSTFNFQLFTYENLLFSRI